MAKKRPEKKTSANGKLVKNVRLQFVPPNVPAFVFANQLAIQSDPHSTYLSFFSSTPPMLAGDPEVVKDQIERLVEVKAHCVAQVVIPRGRLAEFVEAMQRNLKKIQDDQPSSDGNDE